MEHVPVDAQYSAQCFDPSVKQIIPKNKYNSRFICTQWKKTQKPPSEMLLWHAKNLNTWAKDTKTSCGAFKCTYDRKYISMFLQRGSCWNKISFMNKACSGPATQTSAFLLIHQDIKARTTDEWFIMLTIQWWLLARKAAMGINSMCLGVCKVYHIMFDELLRRSLSLHEARLPGLIT